MTFRELCKKWLTSDSISEKEELAEKIEEIGIPFFRKKFEICSKYGVEISHGDYVPDRGSSRLDDATEEHAIFYYEDYCKGCEYSDRYRVVFSEGENPNFFIAPEKKSRLEKKRGLKSEITSLKAQIKEKEKELALI